MIRHILTLALVLAPAACGKAPVGERCTSQDDCGSDLECSDIVGTKLTQCTTYCTEDADCPAGSCRFFSCVAPCSTDTDCPTDTACGHLNICQATCTSSAECREGDVCESSLCVTPYPCETNEDCTLVGQICDAGACVTA